MGPLRLFSRIVLRGRFNGCILGAASGFQGSCNNTVERALWDRDKAQTQDYFDNRA